MTITTTSPSVSYVGDGVSVDFAIPFPFYADGDVRATVGGGAPVFTVGGTYLRFAAAPAAGAAVRVFRVTPRTQLLDLYANGAFPAEGMETALDRIVMMVQELEARLAASEARIAAVPTFPAPAEGLYLRWDASGNLTNGNPGAGGTGGPILTRRTFPANAGQTVFALGATPAAVRTVSVGGIVQPTTAYSIVGSTVVLSAGLPVAMDVTISFAT